MRVGIACNSFGRSGGMEQYALNVIDALIRLGHTPVVFTMSADKTLPSYPHSEVHVCPPNKWLPNKLNVLHYNKWLRGIRKQVPVEFMIACCIAVTAEIAVCGGNHIGYLKAMKRRPHFYDQWIIDLEREMYGNAKFVVAHARTMYRELQAFYHVDLNRMKVIYPPQTFKRLDQELDRKALRKEFGLPEDKTLFLFPSSSHKRKGIDLLRQYFEHTEYPELLVVAGRPLKHPFKNALSIGFCTEMQKLYQACDYTILASSYEPFGMVGTESVASGTPVILGDNIGCCEVLKQNSLRTFDIHSLNSLQQVIEDIRIQPIYLNKPYQKYIDPTATLTVDNHTNQLIDTAKHFIQ